MFGDDHVRGELSRYPVELGDSAAMFDQRRAPTDDRLCRPREGGPNVGKVRRQDTTGGPSPLSASLRAEFLGRPPASGVLCRGLRPHPPGHVAPCDVDPPDIAKAYCAKHDINGLVQDLVEGLLRDRPETKPKEHFAHLLRMQAL